jgi:hypothetical protein
MIVDMEGDLVGMSDFQESPQDIGAFMHMWSNTSGRLSLRSTEDVKFIKMFSLDGRLIAHWPNISKGIHELNFDPLLFGIYVYMAQDMNGRIQSGKCVLD